MSDNEKIIAVAYNHSRKAGNPGDVWKHFILVALADVVAGKSGTFQYVETHCGAPVHRLAETGEWTEGIGAIPKGSIDDSGYLSIARDWLKTNQYPAGWVFTARQLARRFAGVQVHLFDTSRNVAAAYPPAEDLRLPGSVSVKFKRENGYLAVEQLAGPDLVFLDPPFHPDAKADWQSLVRTCSELRSRQINFAVWYPYEGDTAESRVLLDKTDSNSWEVRWASSGQRPGRRLKGCGMLVSEGLIPAMKALEEELTGMADRMGAELFIRQPVKQSR